MASASEPGLRAPRLALATCAEVPDLDPEGRLLAGACREAGIDAEAVVWDEPGVDWDGYDLVLIRSTWDYPAKPREFRAWTERIGEPAAEPAGDDRLEPLQALSGGARGLGLPGRTVHLRRARSRP